MIRNDYNYNRKMKNFRSRDDANDVKIKTFCLILIRAYHNVEKSISQNFVTFNNDVIGLGNYQKWIRWLILNYLDVFEPVSPWNSIFMWSWGSATRKIWVEIERENFSLFIFPRSETSVSQKRDDKFSERGHVLVSSNPRLKF